MRRLQAGRRVAGVQGWLAAGWARDPQAREEGLALDGRALTEYCIEVETGADGVGREALDADALQGNLERALAA